MQNSRSSLATHELKATQDSVSKELEHLKSQLNTGKSLPQHPCALCRAKQIQPKRTEGVFVFPQCLPRDWSHSDSEEQLLTRSSARMENSLFNRLQQFTSIEKKNFPKHTHTHTLKIKINMVSLKELNKEHLKPADLQIGFSLQYIITVELGMYLGWQSACLTCGRPRVQSRAQHKPGMGAADL